MNSYILFASVNLFYITTFALYRFVTNCQSKKQISKLNNEILELKTKNKKLEEIKNKNKIYKRQNTKLNNKIIDLETKNKDLEEIKNDNEFLRNILKESEELLKTHTNVKNLVNECDKLIKSNEILTTDLEEIKNDNKFLRNILKVENKDLEEKIKHHILMREQTEKLHDEIVANKDRKIKERDEKIKYLKNPRRSNRVKQ